MTDMPNTSAVKADMLSIRTSSDLRKRLAVAKAETGARSYSDLLEALLDERDRRISRARAAQAHPLHRPTNATQMEAAQ